MRRLAGKLRFYRDLLKENNPDHPPLHAEGWYSSNQTIHRAEGPSVLEDAFVAWEGMRHSETPFEELPTQPHADSVSGKHGVQLGGWLVGTEHSLQGVFSGTK